MEEKVTTKVIGAKHTEMGARATQLQSLWCGCLQGSPCKTLEMDGPGTHGRDDDTGANATRASRHGVMEKAGK